MGRGKGAMEMTYGTSTYDPRGGGGYAPVNEVVTVADPIRTNDYSEYIPSDIYDPGYSGGPTNPYANVNQIVYRPPMSPGDATQQAYGIELTELQDNFISDFEEDEEGSLGLSILSFLFPQLGLAVGAYNLAQDFAGGEGNRPQSLAEVFEYAGGYLTDKILNAPVVKIGESVFSGELFGANMEWLGDYEDSPWNPANWGESKDPPNWSVYLPDGNEERLIASGTLSGVPYSDTAVGGIGGGSYSPLSMTDEQLEQLSEEGSVTREVTLPSGIKTKVTTKYDPDSAIAYGPASGQPAPPPPGVVVPKGYIYDYYKGGLTKIAGNPYWYRIVDSSNAAYEAGLQDLKLSDEEWLNASEEERQANFEARQEVAQNQYAFGGQTSSSSPFGATHTYGLNEQDLREAYLAGEISSVAFERTLDDIYRNSGGQEAFEAELQEDYNNQLNTMSSQLEGIGFSEDEIQQFIDEHQYQMPTKEGIRSREEYINWYENTTSNDMAVNEMLIDGYTMYDEKRIEDFANLFTFFDLQRGTPQFEAEYNAAPIEARNAYLTYSYQNGTLTEESYKAGIIQNFIESGESVIEIEPGVYALGTSIYKPYQIIQFPNVQGYRAYGEAEGLNIEGASDEFKERRQFVHFLDSSVDITLRGPYQQEPPDEPKWYERLVDDVLKPALIDGLTGGLYSDFRATEKVLTGEANSEDWLQFAPFALEATGQIRPPMSQEEAQEFGQQAYDQTLERFGDPDRAAQAAFNAKEQALKGTGLSLGTFQLDYDQTVKLIEAGITGDLTAFAVDLATPYVEDKLENLFGDLSSDPLVTEWQETWDNMPSDVKSGLNKTMDEMLNGKSFEEAASKGLLKYLEESPFGSRIEDRLREAASLFDDEVLQPIKQFMDELVDVSAAREMLSRFDDKYLQPPKEAGQAATEPTVEAINKNLNELGDEIDDTITATEDLVPQGTTPEFGGDDDDSSGTGTDVDVDLDLDLQAGRRRVFPGEQYEYSDLLKFATQVGVTPQEFIEYQDLLGSDPFGRTV